MNDTLLATEVRRAREQLGLLGRWYAARPRGTPTAELDPIIAADQELERAARTARIDLLAEVDRRAGPFDPSLLAPLLEVQRERFVRAEYIADSAADTPLPLDDEGLATVSAPHAYLLSFRVLGLRAGDRFAELGTGTGYGAALASHVVGRTGSVYTIEIDESLSRRATRLLSGYANVEVECGDASTKAPSWSKCDRVSVTFAVDEIPRAWVDAMPDGGRLVVPVGRDQAQRLVRLERSGEEVRSTDHGAVRYVRNRGAEASFSSFRPK